VQFWILRHQIIGLFLEVSNNFLQSPHFSTLWVPPLLLNSLANKEASNLASFMLQVLVISPTQVVQFDC